MANKGDLYVRIYQASITRSINSSGKMNPYVKIKLGSDAKVTPAHMGATVEAKFYHNLIFQRTFEEIINIELWSMNRILKNDLIGNAQIDLSKIITNNYTLCDWIPLSYKGKEAGRIFIEFRFLPDKKMYLDNKESEQIQEIEIPREEQPQDIIEIIQSEEINDIHPEMIKIDAKEIRIGSRDFDTETTGESSTLRLFREASD